MSFCEINYIYAFNLILNKEQFDKFCTAKTEKKSIEEKSKKLAQQFLEKKEKEQMEEDSLMTPVVMEDKLKPGQTLKTQVKKDLSKMKLIPLKPL